MRMMGKSYWVALVAIVCLGACKAKKAVVAPVVTAPVVAPTTNNKAENLKLLKAKDI
jgi:hypothetical protein